MIALTLAEMAPVLGGELLGSDARITSVGIDSRQLDRGGLYALGENSRRAVQSFGPGGAHCDTAEALIQALRQALATTTDRPTLLVKGSRSMRMERIVQALTTEPDAGREVRA